MQKNEDPFDTVFSKTRNAVHMMKMFLLWFNPTIILFWFEFIFIKLFDENFIVYFKSINAVFRLSSPTILFSIYLFCLYHI